MMKVFHNIRIDITDAKTGRLLSRRLLANKVVNGGLQVFRDQIGGVGARANIIALGTGTAATGDSDSALGAEVYRKQIDRRIERTYGIEHQALIAAADANGYDLSEIALFRNSKMVNRALISPAITKTSAIQVTASIIIDLTRG